MNSKIKTRVVATAALAVTLGMAACGASNEATPSGSGSGSGSGSALSGNVNGAGSSAQSAAMTAWIAGFQKSNPSAQINYDAVGSGAGVEQFLNGGVGFAGSDKALTADQLTAGQSKCGAAALDVPTYVSPIAVAYNLKGVDDLQLSPETLAGIFAGKITTWDDQAIKSDNPGVSSLPSTKITPVHRSDKSGTTNNFTDYLSKAAPDAWTSGAVEEWPLSGGESAKGTSGVIAVLKGGDGTIGYADESQVGDLQTTKIKVGSSYNAPSADGAAKTLSDSKTVTGRPDGDVVIDINRTTTADGAYPVLLVSYEIFCTKYANQAQGDLVKGLLTYMVSSDGQQTAASAAGSAPLPDSVASQAKSSIDKITSGS